jgi:peptidoglycan/xylan/chitin deacetylase (PgdA/CDA1 family)
MRKYFFIFSFVVFGFLLGYLAFKLINISSKELIKNDFLSRKQISEAPYYEQKVFQRPRELDMPKNASISAIATDSPQFRLPIIMFHYVEYIKDIGDLIRRKLNISPYIFEKELEELDNNNYTTYFVRDIPNIFEKKIEYASKSAVLSFDDGYEDFYSVVFPLLKKYQKKATVYIIVNYIGRKGFLNEEEINELISSGLVEIGCHTLNHAYLQNMSYDAAKKEIFECKEELSSRFKIKIETFAYPYGAFSKETVDIVKEASFSAAVSVIPGIYHTKDSLFYLYRLRPGLFTPEDFIKKLNTPF